MWRQKSVITQFITIVSRSPSGSDTHRFTCSGSFECHADNVISTPYIVPVSTIFVANTGISLGWGWARDEAVNARDNTITANYVYGEKLFCYAYTAFTVSVAPVTSKACYHGPRRLHDVHYDAYMGIPAFSQGQTGCSRMVEAFTYSDLRLAAQILCRACQTHNISCAYESMLSPLVVVSLDRR